jgi:TonB family protein
MSFAFLAAAAAAASIPRASPVDLGSWFKADDYPAEAMKHNVEGSVTFEVEVDASGKPTACRIAKSSKSAILDQATCDIVMKRAQFKPAMRHGKAVAGRYSNRSIWKLGGDVNTADGWFAALLDFSKDAAHPTCSIESKDLSVGLTCEEAVRKFGSAGMEKKVTKLVVMMSFTSGGAQPFPGKPEWGRRVSFIAFELSPPKQGTKPACITVAEQGYLPGDPCAQFANGLTLFDSDKQSTGKAHIELSRFEVARPAALPNLRCKRGESEAEARGCV